LAANAGLQGSTVLALAVHPTQPDIVYAGTNTGLMKTLDGGMTWTALPWSPNSASTGCNAVVILRARTRCA
jgi:hypothetical protein